MLRDFQQQLKNEGYQAWHEGAIDICVTMATGGGKTALFCDIAREFNTPAVAIAHRQELVSQAAMAFNRENVPHSIIAPKDVIRQVIALEHETHGHSCFNSRAPVRVAGVDTLRNYDAKDRWLSQVGLVIQDEGHHQLRDNKWGRARLMFPNARGLAVTAHAVRADGRGLGRQGDGFIDRLVIGPHGKALINRGFLTNYTIFCPESDIEFDEKPGPSGEFNMPRLRAATHKSNRIVGDVVKCYLKWAAGKLGVTFAVDKEEAIKLRNAYQAAGVPAEIITDETPITVRGQLMRKFRARQILQLVSVDCLGEGVDVPAIEVVSLVRKTASWQLFCQQFGRALRVMVDERYWAHWNEFSDEERLAIIAQSPKSRAIIIDHVGNVIWHAKNRGLPDSKQAYSLLTTERSARQSDAIPQTRCLACFKPYESYLIACPYCGTRPIPADRSSPQMVAGDMIELDPEVLAVIRGEADRIIGPVVIPQWMNKPQATGLLRNHHKRATSQHSLRHVMMLWGDWQRQIGRSERESQKLFFIKFGVDYLSAQGFNAADAMALEVRVRSDMQASNVMEAVA